MRIILSGGGTGGHITPLLAVADALNSRGNQLIYIGEGTRQERLLMQRTGMEMHTVSAGKFRRYHGQGLWAHVKDVRTVILNIRDGFKFALGIIQSLYLLLRLKPEVVFSKGGYVALPVGLAARLLRIPVVTHDSDVAPGLTNRILNRFGTVRACGFPRAGSVFTGNPVRRELLEAEPAAIKSDKPVVLFMGGSSGAYKINSAVFEALPELTARYHVLHITGTKDFGRAPAQTADYHPYDFVGPELGGLVKAAAVVVSRAGANAIAEFAACGKAVVLIPGAQLTGGQQIKNARALAEKQAACVLEEKGLNTRGLLAAIESTLSTRERYEAAIKEFYQPDAPEKLATLIMQSNEKKTS